MQEHFSARIVLMQAAMAIRFRRQAPVPPQALPKFEARKV